MVENLQEFNDGLVEYLKNKGYKVHALTPYKVTDYTGMHSSHWAANEDVAIQKHLLHYGLLYLSEEPWVEDIRNVPEAMELICDDSSCLATKLNSDES